MTRDRHQRAKQLFLEACELPVAERPRFLDRSCADDEELRELVVRMLAVDEQAPAFLAAPSARSADGLRAGEVLDGKYEVVERIGEGGLGEVWRARQGQPVQRDVAIKVVKPGLDTRRVVARFEAERQTLAILDHPNIAKVLDAGSTRQGRPYFVMELIDGRPITDHVEALELDLRARLELFLTVCAAAQHAHQKGIIHRDIKPSNVLVTGRNEHGMVKVIDFGVAKAVEGHLGGAALATVEHQVIGTPAYMSPEQASGSRDLDTRTDVYALGVLLYEILTETTPFEAERLRDSDFVDAVRIICEEEPLRPSTRVSRRTAAATSSQRRRRTTAEALRGDLDWIVLRALEKDRERRYPSAEALADDVRRHLRHEPVVARPPSRVYQISKFARRNRAAVSVGVLLLVTLLAGLVLVSLARSDAVAAKEKASAEATAAMLARDAEARARVEAEDALEEADTATRFLADLLGASSPLRSGMDVRVIDILARSDAEIREKFQDRPRVEIRLRRTIGIAYRHLGKLSEAQANLERALAVAREVHSAEDPVVLDAINSMVALYDERGLFELSEPLHRELIDLRIRVHGQEARRTLGAMCNLGLFYYDQSRFDEAEVQLRTTLERMRQSMEPDDEYLLNCMQGLGTALMGLERLHEARALFEEVLRRTEAHSDGSHLLTILAVGNLAEVARLEGNHRESLDLLDDVLGRCSRTFPDDHWRVGNFLYTKAAVLEALGRRDEALEQCLRARQIYAGAHGPAHETTLAADARLVRLYEELGRSQEADRWRTGGRER